MLVRPITYTDLDGVVQTENFHFNLTISEVSEIELDIEGGLSEHLLDVVERKDARELLAIYKMLIERAYGERSSDGKYFLKTDDNDRPLGKMFLQHPAYDVLFFELMGAGDESDEAFMKFLEGCLPKELIEKMPDAEELPKLIEERRAKKDSGDTLKEARDYSRSELLAMSDEEFEKVAGTDPQKMDPEVLRIAFQRKGTKISRDS